MRILDRYILREIASYAGLSLGVFLFILMTPEVLRLSELLARENLPLPKVAVLFLSVVPGKLLWVIPVSVLVSLLVALSRVAADSEVIALGAAGVSPTRLLRPVLLFAALGAGLTLAATAWWGPLGARTVRQLQADLAAGQASYEVRARVFEERFPNYILYVQDTEAGMARWRGVLLADLSDSENSRLTLAESAVVVPEPERHRLRVHLSNGTSHSYGVDRPERYSVTTFAENVLNIPLPAAALALQTRRHADLGLAELWAASRSGPQWRSARADFHRRLALPAACLIFALAALPLSLLAQGSGRAVGVVTAVVLAISYYFIFLLGDRLAREGALAPGLGVWLANLSLFVPAVVYFSGVRWPRSFTLALLLRIGFLARALWMLAGLLAAGTGAWWLLAMSGVGLLLALLVFALALLAGLAVGLVVLLRLVRWRLARTLDLYVARGVVFHFALLLVALVILFAVFTVLEMVDDIAAHNIAWPTVARFLWYLLPQAAYWMAPLAFLLGLLVELALLSKRNELVAIKGIGISLYRVALPLVLTGLGVSALLFALDHYYLPQANQRQEVLRNQIKGRPPQTYLPAHRQWIFGERPRIYHYAFFEASRSFLGRVTVLELDPETFSLRRRLYARRAHWEPELKTWVLEQGWERSFAQGRTVSYQAFQVASFPHLTEPPAYFQKELRESALMNWSELGDYIAELRQSGFDVTQLRVQWHRKFAFPLIATIVVLLAFPFGLTTGRRGAVGGLAIGITLGFSYWALAFGFFEALGNLGLLPPLLAAWGPNLLFAFAGIYLTLQIDT